MTVWVKMAVYIVYHVHGISDPFRNQMWRKAQVNQHGNMAVTNIVDPYGLYSGSFTAFYKAAAEPVRQNREQAGVWIEIVKTLYIFLQMFT